ncbi:hypothetical protein BGX23_005631, partial [Mortierella sp. AD031]
SFHNLSFKFKLTQVFKSSLTVTMAKLFENTFFKNVPLSTFKGHPKENVQDWLNELDEYLEAVNATPVQK